MSDNEDGMGNIIGKLTSCPECDDMAGVPVPYGATIVETTDQADNSTITLCSACETRFEVLYSVETDD